MLALRWLVCAAVIALLCRMAATAGAERTSNPWRALVARFRRHRPAMLALYVIIALYVIAVLSPWLTAYDPNRQLDIIALKNLPPSARFLFGTDYASRDVFSRVLAGGAISLSVASLAIVLAATLGTAYGATAGYYGGRVDTIMMRVLDALLAIPRIVLLLAIAALWGGLSVPAMVMLLGLTGWFATSRIVRAQVLALREQDLVVAARALGASNRRIVWRHLVPNVLSPVIVAATLGIGNLIIAESGLSYLGIGLRPPQASWGNIIQDGAELLATDWWVAFFPGIAMLVTVIAFNLVGDGLRDALDPRQLDG